MVLKLNGETLPYDVPFTVGTGENAVNYPANWLRLTSLEEKKAIGITEVDESKTYDYRFYNSDGSEKSLVDVDATYTEDDPDTGAKKGEIISQQMDMTKMIPHLTKALQEAITKIETLEAEVTALKAKVG